MKTVLVTGGAGFVGAQAYKTLAQAGYLPVAYDNLSTGWADAARFGPLVEGDLLDPSALRAAFETHRPVAVLHCAAKTLVSEAETEPEVYWRANALGTLEVLRAMTRHGVDALVFSSSCAVYGALGDAPATEETPTRPVNAYGASKLAAEHMIESFAQAHGLRAARFRYFNAAGADPDGDVGERHEPETHLIPIALQAAAGLRAAVCVFGEDYPTPDGSCIRDYVHVADLCEAHRIGLDRLLDGWSGGAFNLGAGRGSSVFDVLDLAREVTGHPIPWRSAARRPGDPARLVADPSRADEVLKWRAKRSLRMMIEDAWRYIRSRGSAGEAG